MSKTTFKQKIMLMVFGIFLCVITLEVGLRIGGFVFLTLKEQHNNVSSNKENNEYRIMCLGESTTACGGENSYPSQLENILNNKKLKTRFKIINKAIPKNDSSIIVSHLNDNITKYAPDMIITMMGINDVPHRAVFYKDAISQKSYAGNIKDYRVYKLCKLILAHIQSKREKIIGMEFSKKINKLNSIDYKTAIAMGDYYINSGRDKEAIEMYKKAIMINPNESIAFFKLGKQYLFQEEYAKAEEALKSAIQKNAGYDEAYSALGNCYRNQGRYKEAAEAYKKGLELNPSNPWDYTELGECYRAQGDYNNSKEMFKKAIEKDMELGNMSNALIRGFTELGWLYREDGQHREAEEIFNEVTKRVDINLNSFERDRLYGSLAVDYMAQGKYRESEELFKKANEYRLRYYYPATRSNYQKLKEAVIQRGIKLVCVQYPMRSIEPLKKFFDSTQGVIFVDNEKIFKDALKKAKYEDYFTDNFGGDFGHCTPRGNGLLSENVANVILKESLGLEKNNNKYPVSKKDRPKEIGQDCIDVEESLEEANKDIEFVTHIRKYPKFLNLFKINCQFRITYMNDRESSVAFLKYLNRHPQQAEQIYDAYDNYSDIYQALGVLFNKKDWLKD